ncbi:regulatory protein RecX [Aeromicrobium wangtongii]|uniref:Regulatory protein RecX n=1 Tax=Aeromicrobium wangtongii TaxID=2969247 RepID=A0ABY5M2J0_9ACTN|nr:regulatory protein RecX [Aeromicrobium wangtongii]MCD9198398.1 recombination regulator RecX [Aeromicrobium wangtongii]UUP12428.1 recombination regulator RecX [Aeromicrobium wangtongii]
MARTPVDEMTPEELASFAKEVVVRKLSERAHSRGELSQALAKKQVPEGVVEATLAKFEVAGLIDDEDFARSWVQARQRGKGLSSRALADELRRKGVDDELTKQVLGELDPEVELEAAHRLVQTRLRSMSRLDEATKMRRLVGMLARKGYAPQLAVGVVRSELGSEAEALESM